MWEVYRRLTLSSPAFFSLDIFGASRVLWSYHTGVFYCLVKLRSAFSFTWFVALRRCGPHKEVWPLEFVLPVFSYPSIGSVFPFILCPYYVSTTTCAFYLDLFLAVFFFNPENIDSVRRPDIVNVCSEAGTKYVSIENGTGLASGDEVWFPQLYTVNEWNWCYPQCYDTRVLLVISREPGLAGIDNRKARTVLPA